MKLCWIHFFGILVIFYKLQNVEPQDSAQSLQDEAVGENSVPETTYNCCPTGVPHHYLELREGAQS